MAYVVIEASVRTHRKFLAVGPAAAWLWVCGLGYCQEGMTDGAIPASALQFLGVKPGQVGKLAERLVKGGLWEKTTGGWHMHDYLEHNKSAEQIRATMRKRAVGGSLGGRPKQTLEVIEKVNHTVNPILPSDLPTFLPQDQDQVQREDARSSHRVLVKLAHDVLNAPEAKGQPQSELDARLKDSAAKAGIPYNGREAAKAMDSAMAQRARRSA